MRFSVICNLIAHSWFENERTTVFELCAKLTFKAKENVALCAPVVSKVPRRVFDHSDSNIAKLACTPDSFARFAAVINRFDG